MKFKPINNDILIKSVKKNEIHDSVIEVVDRNHGEEHLQYFEVLAVADAVKKIEVGDKIVLPWTKVTPPFVFDVNGKDEEVGITEDKEVYAIIKDL